MFLFAKDANNINIYSLNGKKEELIRYKEKELSKVQDKPLFYDLKTNCNETIKYFQNNDDIDLDKIDYDKRMPLYRYWLEEEPWSKFYSISDYWAREFNYTEEARKRTLEKYISGEYDSLKPARIYELTDYGTSKKKVLNIIKTFQEPRFYIGTTDMINEISNIIALPDSLYLLHLLCSCEYSKLEDEDLTEQLALFDIELVRSIALSDINLLLSTKLVEGNMESINNKAETGSKILTKAKKINI